MTTMSARRRATAWMTPRWRDPGWYAFVLNRFTGLILVAYLLAHFVVLSRLTAGAEGWNDLLGLFGSRPFLVGDVLLVSAVIFRRGRRTSPITRAHSCSTYVAGRLAGAAEAGRVATFGVAPLAALPARRARRTLTAGTGGSAG